MYVPKKFPFKGLGPLIKVEPPYQSNSLLVGVCVPKSVRGKHCNHDDDDCGQDNHCGDYHNDYLTNNGGKDKDGGKYYSDIGS